jgi:hypothetical protein
MRALITLLTAAMFFAGDVFAHGPAAWIATGRYVSPIDGQHCCGEHDCFEIQNEQVRSTGSGYLLIHLNEIVPFREAQPSKDGNYWRCKKPDGSRRCFFAPPSAV